MLKAFAVYDMKAAAYGSPMFMSNAGLALRGFSDAVADPQCGMAKHPEDYTLYEIGTWEPNDGILTALTPPVIVAAAASVMALVRPAPELPKEGELFMKNEGNSRGVNTHAG